MTPRALSRGQCQIQRNRVDHGVWGVGWSRWLSSDHACEWKGPTSPFIPDLPDWLLTALFLDLGAPCKVPNLLQWTEAPGKRAVLLSFATRGRAEHMLGGPCQSLRETAIGA